MCDDCARSHAALDAMRAALGGEIRREEVPGTYASVEVASLETTLEGLRAWAIVESSASFGDPAERGLGIHDLPRGPHLGVTLAVRRRPA